MRKSRQQEMIGLQLLDHHVEHAAIVDREPGHRNRQETHDAPKQERDKKDEFYLIVFRECFH